MLTLKRFRALVDSYGADILRWPEAERGGAEALLTVSAEAKACFEQARRLDDAIMSASIGASALAWPVGEQDAALARLRFGVKARLAHKEAAGNSRAGRDRADWLSAFPLRWLGAATGGGFAVAAGLVVGLTYAASPVPASGTDTVLAMLQPAPIPVLAEFGGGEETHE